MRRYEALLLEAPSRLCLVVGDLTSTMACAIAAQKLCIPVAHVEGGIRSGDWSMPEEINRMVTDSITNWFFTTSAFANANLRKAGVGEERIHFVGNTMIDTLLANMDRLRPPAFWDALGLEPGGYFVITRHRPANVDQPEKLRALLSAIAAGTETDQRLVFTGDLGAPNTPLLPAPQPPERADVLVLESTYGDRRHQGRAQRIEQPPPSFRPGSRNPCAREGA
jgi:UDP-N-acetylglucosamine 2-epimerase